jgi:hypothetical protein
VYSRRKRTLMAYYMQFTASHDVDSTILVEVDEDEVSSPEGMVKAGVEEAVKKTVARASSTFEEALKRVVRLNSEAFIQSVHSLSELPDEVEVSFGCKVIGEVGNIAIARGAGKRTTPSSSHGNQEWKRSSKMTADDLIASIVGIL